MFQEQICLLEGLILCRLQLNFFCVCADKTVPGEEGRVEVWDAGRSLVSAFEWPILDGKLGVYRACMGQTVVTVTHTIQANLNVKETRLLTDS